SASMVTAWTWQPKQLCSVVHFWAADARKVRPCWAALRASGLPACSGALTATPSQASGFSLSAAAARDSRREQAAAHNKTAIWARMPRKRTARPDDLLLANQRVQRGAVGSEELLDLGRVDVGDDDLADLVGDGRIDAALLHPVGLVLVVVGRRE